MGKIKRMDQIINILKAYQSTASVKGTARQCGVSKNTIRGYLRLLDGRDLATVLALPDEQLRAMLYPDKVRPSVDRQAVFEANTTNWIKELGRKGVTRQLLYEEYKRDHPDGYGQTQFYVHLARAIDRRDLTLPLSHEPGEKLQLDFAGKTLGWVDADSGEVRQCQVLIGVLPHSQHTFAIALPSQRTADFVHGINEILRFFGGLPKVILSDNLKAFVIRADRYDPDFNDVMRQLADHYQIDLQATRPGKPKDKASVENAVRIAYTRLYAPLRDQIFHSPEALNAALREQCELHQDIPFQRREGSRRSCFEAHERPVMRPLPTAAFVLKKTVRAKVQKNYHVFVGEGKNFYSVPFQHVGRTATVVYTRVTVEVFVGADRVATHARLHASDRYRYQTDAAHMPKNHAEWRKAEGYDAAYFRAWAAKIGPATVWAIGQILLTKIHEPQTYRSCQGTLALAKKYGDERLENAAARCGIAGRATFGMLRNILEKNLDRQTDQLDLFTSPDHDNIRGSQAYQ